ncbi:MAG TPA: type II secretion system protein GspG [Pyrinomonadaceae bacterium]|nr:type II secretion system protein GspG [Pyrinomonadaceae bacterium]
MLRTRLWFGCLFLGLLAPVQAHGDLSQSNARKAIQTMGGWSLPSSAVRIQSFNSNGAEAAEVSAEIQAVFRLRLREGVWELREIRTGPDRWERLDVIAQAAGAELPRAECDAPAQFTNIKSSSELTNRRARCLIAELLGIQLPSDDVRIREVSPFGLSLGAESSALVTALVRVDFRFAREAKRWSVVEFKSGNRDWVSVSGIPAAMDQVKRTEAANELLTVAKALGDFRRDRGYFVVSKSESVLIDHLSPRYLARVIRIDPWHRPYHYDGQQDRYSLRSAGPDGKANTADDIVVSGP